MRRWGAVMNITQKTLDKLNKQANRTENLIYALIAYALIRLANMRYAWRVLDETDPALAYADFERTLSTVMILLLFAILVAPFVLYPIWVVVAVRHARSNGADNTVPAPGTALLHHILPPFLLYTPHQTIIALQNHWAALLGKQTSGLDTLLATLWWGTFWLAIILEIVRRTYLDNGTPTSMAYFNLTLAVSLLSAISALCLAQIVNTIAKNTNTFVIATAKKVVQ